MSGAHRLWAPGSVGFSHGGGGGGGEELPYERGGIARRKCLIKPLKETNLGVAQAFFDPLNE